jgi:hypothetical protein
LCSLERQAAIRREHLQQQLAQVVLGCAGGWDGCRIAHVPQSAIAVQKRVDRLELHVGQGGTKLAFPGRVPPIQF